MATITLREARVRIRRLFLEETTPGSQDFVDDTGDEPYEVDDAYDQGCSWQLEQVIHNADQAGKLRRHDHPYLLRYLVHSSIAISAGTSDYPCPTDMLRRITLYVAGREAVYVEPSQDRLIQLWPSQFGPAKGEALWTFVPSADGVRVIRVYVAGVGTTPNEPVAGIFDYYRTVTRLAFQSPPTLPSSLTDCDDPFNFGPIKRAAAQLFRKAGQIRRAEELEQQAMEDVALIVPPPQQVKA